MVISLYFHIPFCTKKCHYCHFYVLPDKEELKNQLLEGLELEYRANYNKIEGKKIASIYFGGGTPFLFSPERIAKILSWVTNRCSDIEITLEANPDVITKTILKEYKDAGINRLSIGVQSFCDPLLKVLGRTHSSKKAIDSIQYCQDASIDNISIDLMYDLPNQTLQMWNETLSIASKLPITHLSLYNLTIEPHTLFYKKQSLLKKVLPNEDESLKMYQNAIEILTNAGLKQYEISAFAKNHLLSKHNTGYWTNRSFLGFGPSAFSFYEGKRYRNVANQSKYLKAIHSGLTAVDFEEELSKDAALREALTLQLRLLEGVDIDQFKDLDFKTKSAIEILIENQFLELLSKRLKLTKKGILFYDSVAVELI